VSVTFRARKVTDTFWARKVAVMNWLIFLLGLFFCWAGFGADPYSVLGVKPGDDFESVIRPAYRKLALENHPDRHPGDKVKEAKFAQVAEAYEILYDAERTGVAYSDAGEKQRRRNSKDAYEASARGKTKDMYDEMNGKIARGNSFFDVVRDGAARYYSDPTQKAGNHTRPYREAMGQFLEYHSTGYIQQNPSFDEAVGVYRIYQSLINFGIYPAGSIAPLEIYLRAHARTQSEFITVMNAYFEVLPLLKISQARKSNRLGLPGGRPMTAQETRRIEVSGWLDFYRDRYPREAPLSDPELLIKLAAGGEFSFESFSRAITAFDPREQLLLTSQLLEKRPQLSERIKKFATALMADHHLVDEYAAHSTFGRKFLGLVGFASCEDRMSKIAADEKKRDLKMRRYEKSLGRTGS
jgi:hypothetical protein